MKKNNYIKYLLQRNKLWEQKYILNTAQIYKDPILQKYKFTNIWRELDSFSKEEIQRIKSKPLLDQIIIIAIARHSVNWKTTDLLLNNIQYEELFDYWQSCKKENIEFVSNAILLQAPKGSNRAKLLIQHRNRVFHYAAKIEKAITFGFKPDKILQLINDVLKCGPFRSYEIYTSLTYCEKVYFSEDDITHIGPGSIQGFQEVFGKYMTAEYIPKIIEDLTIEIKDTLLNYKDFYWIPEKMQGSINNKKKHKFTIRTLEDSMCEYRKYYNLCNNKGKGRLYKNDYNLTQGTLF